MQSGKIGQAAGNHPVWGSEHVIEAADTNKIIKIFTANFCGLQRCPSNGQGVHAINIFQLVSHETTILATTAWDNHIIATVIAAMSITQIH